jgi:uridine kinase
LLVGIAGGSGCGKSTLAAKIVESLPTGSTLLIQHDAYYRDRSHLPPAERALINFDEPDALENDLLSGHLRSLRAGTPVDCPQYDYASHVRRPQVTRLVPRPVILVEGMLLFAVPSLRDIFDLRLFVDAADDVRLMRRIKRDLLERGRDIASVEAQYFGSVRAMHRLHVEPSKQHAHLLIPEGGENAQALDVIVGRLAQALDKPTS